MHRRRFLAGAALAALSGCLGDDPRKESSRAGEPSREVDWEPTATDGNDRDSSDEEPPNPAENGTKGEGTEGTDGGDDRAPGAFDRGTTWEADEAQVAAGARKAGATVQFELATTPPEPCGRTCRELRATLTNAGTETAHDVVVDTELASGGTVLRERRTEVGDLPAGETYRAAERVELGALEAIRVKRNDTLTVEHVVTSVERREVFRERLDP